MTTDRLDKSEALRFHPLPRTLESTHSLVVKRSEHAVILEMFADSICDILKGIPY